MSSIKKNFLYSSVYQILLVILPLLTSPYVSRVLEPDGLGSFSYTQSIAKYFVLFAMLGVSNYGNRSCAFVRGDKEKLSRTFCEIYTMQLCVSLICYITYIILSFSFEKEIRLLLLLNGCYVLSAVFDISWLFFSLEQFKITVTRNIIVKLISVVCIFIFVKTKTDCWKYTLIIAASFLANQLVMWPFLKRYVYFVKPSFKDVLKHLKPNVILFLPVLAMSVYRVMDKVMLGAMSTMTETGYYENADKIVNIPAGIITAFGSVMLPRMSYLASENQENKIQEMIYKSILFVVFMASALCFGISGITQKFTPWFFGDDYSSCAQLISYLSIILLFTSWASVIRTQYIIPHKFDNEYTISIVLGAVVNVFLNFVLIPIYGAWGAVIGTIGAEVTSCVGQTFVVRKELPIKRYIIDSIPFALNGLIMKLIVGKVGDVFCAPTVIVLFVQIVIGAGTYLLLSGFYVKFRFNIYLRDMLNLVNFRKGK